MSSHKVTATDAHNQEKEQPSSSKRSPTIIDITNEVTGERCDPSSALYEMLAKECLQGLANYNSQDWLDDDGQPMDFSEPSAESIFDAQTQHSFRVRLTWTEELSNPKT